MRAFLLCGLVAILGSSAAVMAAPPNGWKLLRGDWDRSGEGVGSCRFDPAMYEKHDKHGPIAIKRIDVTDAVLEATFTLTGEVGENPKTAPRVVLTLDAEKGHAVRVWLYPAMQTRPTQSSRAAAWTEGTKKPTPIIRNGKLPALRMGEEMTVAMRTEGETLTVTIDGETFTASHPGVARGKSNAKLSFAFGDLQLTELAAGPLEAATN